MWTRCAVAALFMLLGPAQVAAADGLTGPIYPIPGHAGSSHGGNTCLTVNTVSPPGSAAGTTWNFGGGGAADSTSQLCTAVPAANTTPSPFDTERFVRAYWGLNPTARPRVAMDSNFLDSNGETLTFRPQTSNLPGGVLVWEGTTTMIVCPCPPLTGPGVDTRLTVKVTNISPGVTGTPPVALVAPAAAGVTGANAAEIGGLVPISPQVTRFRVNFTITARLSSPAGQAYETAETFYNARTHPATEPGFVSSITGAFWYENRPPVLDFTNSNPQADTPINFTATTVVDPDGAITSNGWDFTNDNVFESSALSAQWSFPPGEWPVSLVAVDNERNAQWPAGRKTVLTKAITVPVQIGDPPPPPPPPPINVDGDGFPAALDCNDNNAAIHPGAFDVPANGVDEDCNGVDAPLLTMAVSVTWTHKADAKATRFTALSVKNVVPGSTIAVSCKGKKCPKKLTIRNATGTVVLKTYLRRKFPVNDVIEIRVTHDGYTGIVKTLKIRKSAAPLATTKCLPPGAAKPTKCA